MPLIRFVPNSIAKTHPLEKYVFYTTSGSDTVNNEIIKLNTNISLIGLTDLDSFIKYLIGESNLQQITPTNSEFSKLSINKTISKYHGELLNRASLVQPPPSQDLFIKVATRYNDLLNNPDYYFYEIGIDIHQPNPNEPQSIPNLGKPRGNIEIKFAKIKRDHQNDIIIGADGLPEVDKDHLFLLNAHIFFNPTSRLEIAKSTVDLQLKIGMAKYTQAIPSLEQLTCNNYCSKEYKIIHPESKSVLKNIQTARQNTLLFVKPAPGPINQALPMIRQSV